MRKPTFEQTVALGFALAIFVLIAVALTAFISAQEFAQTSRRAIGNAELIIPLDELFSRVYAAESAQRGYLLSGSDAYLAQRRTAVQGARDIYDALLVATEGNPVLRERIQTIGRLAEERIALLDRVLTARRNQGPAVSRKLLAAQVGRNEMRALRETIDEVRSERLGLLRRYGAEARSDGRLMLVSFLLMVLFVNVLLIVLMGLIRREMRRHRRASEELGEREARLNAVVNTAVDAIVVIDDRGIIESFNPAAERIFGYAADEAIGRNVGILMPSPYREEHDGYIERYRRTREPRIIGTGREVLAQRRDGTVFPADLAVAEFWVGTRQRFSGLVRDITTRKRDEARLTRTLSDLEAANEELKNFAYVASHDLKAPLRAIGSLADWISTDYADKFDDEGREQMRLLMSRVKRMDRLIDGILQYSRVGRVGDDGVETDLNRLVTDTVDLLAPPPHVRVNVDDLPTLNVEPVRIQQVFQNLLSNAIRYLNKPEGRIHVGCSETEQGFWRFSVADNGPGIEARHLERIFLLFQTLAPRDRTESTGIGLALVKKIVESHGGRVWVESIPGEGSTFYFTLPKTRPDGRGE